MNIRALQLLAMLAFVTLSVTARAEGDKLKLLIMSGAHNHSWKTTTQV